MKLTQIDYERVEAVMDGFEFKDAQKIIALWITNSPEDHYSHNIPIPTVDELKVVGRDLLMDVLKDDLNYAGTRFLKAYKIKWDGNDPHEYTLGLTLDIVEYDVEPEDLESELIDEE